MSFTWEHVAMNKANTKDTLYIDKLLDPAGAYQHPAQVVADTDLTLNEKRAVLASWASDACAVEASPELRQPTDGPPIPYDTIMEALRKLDGEAAQKTNYGRLINRARRIRDLYRPAGNGRAGFG
jgi:hypothetical protein